MTESTQRRGAGASFVVALVVLCVLVALASVASLAIGQRMVPFGDVVSALVHPGSGSDFVDSVIQQRVPRTLFALAAGAALGLSGLLMQRVTRNPIADPSILGINSGAALAVVVGLAFTGISTSGEYTLYAVVGAGLTAALVYGVALGGGTGASPLKLALAGTAVSTALSSLTSILMMPRQHVMSSFRLWQVGSVGGAGWDAVQVMAVLVALAVVASLLIAPALDVLALGDEAAAGLGARPGLIRFASSAIAVVLCGATTAFAGPIAFVGLMVPHVVSLLHKGSLRQVMVLSALGGALLLTASDVLGRVLGGQTDLEVGIVTAILGAPVFIAVAIHWSQGSNQRKEA